MNARSKPRGRGCLVALLVVLLLLALLCAAPFLYNRFITHYEYDDFAALAANAAPVNLSADGERLIFRLDKGAAYARLLEEGALETLQAELGGRATVERLGYSLSPEGAEVRLAVKLFGFLPLQLQAEADVAVNAAELSFKPVCVRLGPWIRIRAEKLAERTGADALREGFALSLTEYTEPLRADRVWIEDDGLALSSALLAEVLDEVAAQPTPDELRLLRLYFGDREAAPDFFGAGRAEFLRAAGASLEALRNALRDAAAYGSEPYRRALSEALSALPFDLSSGLEALDLPQLRAAQRGRAAEAQALYHAAQTELRRAYWYREVMLKNGRLTEMDGTLLEARCPAEWEARIVLQYNENYDAIVKTNEGNPRLQVPIPGLPMMSELKRDSRASLPAEGDGPFDLTLALRLPSGTPVVVFLTPEDEFGLAVISEALFSAFRDDPRLPVRSSAAVAAAPRSEWLRLDPGDGQPAGNYINLP